MSKETPIEKAFSLFGDGYWLDPELCKVFKECNTAYLKLESKKLQPTQSDAVEFTKWQFMEGYKPKFGKHSNKIKWAKDPYLWKRGEQNDFTSEELYAKWKEEQK